MPSFRQISLLQYVRICSPRAGQAGRAGSAKMEGLHFEQVIGDIILEGWKKNYSKCWFEFVDSNGIGWCQVDHGFFLESGEQVIVECKRRWHSYAKGQVLGLYKPVAEFYWKRAALCIVACLQGRGEKTMQGLEAAIEVAKGEKDGFAIW